MIPLVDLNIQYSSIKQSVDCAIAAVIAENAFIKGKYTEAFEREFAEYLEARHCIGCGNGTDALEIILRALGLGAGDEVIVPANTWISTAEAVTSVGARVVFADSHPELYTIDVRDAEKKITARTKAIIPVHLYGLPAEMDEIMQLARRHNLRVVEDCAQAHGARYKGRRTGTVGDAAAFSFFPSKVLGSFGDAGAIITGDEQLARRCRMIGDHGRVAKHDHLIEGRNSRLDGLQAAVLSAKLPHLEEWIEKRRRNAEAYRGRLENSGITLPAAPAYSRHVFYSYVVQVPNRQTVQEELDRRKIGWAVHYPRPLPLLPAYAYLHCRAEDFPAAVSQMNRIISLPMYPELSEQQINEVADAVQTACAKQNGENR